MEEPAGPEFPDDRSESVVPGRGPQYEEYPPRRGRPRKAYDQNRLSQVLNLYFVEKMSMRQVADVMGISHMSVYRMLSDPAVELLI